MTGLALASLVVACGPTGSLSSVAPAISAHDKNDEHNQHDELDALLAAAPRMEAFAAIRSWLEGQPEGPAREAALARALVGLQRWPDATRWAPEGWVYALARGEVHPLWPLIRRVDVSFLDEQKFDAIFGAAAMATITDLRVQAWSGHARVLAALFASPHLGRVTALDLGRFGSEGARALLQSPMLTRLRRLVLGRIEEAEARSLANEPALRGLVALDVTLAGLSGGGADGLLRSPHLQQLRELRLSSLDDDGAAGALAAGFPALRSLSLNSARLGPAGLQRVFTAGFFAGLEALDLGYTRIDEASAALLVRSLGSRLRVLDLAHTTITDRTLVALAGSQQLGGLRALRPGDRIGSAGVLALVRAPQLGAVQVTGFYVYEQLDRAALLEVLASPRLVDHPQRERWRYEAELLDLSLTPDEAQASIPADAQFTLFRPAPFSPWRGDELGIDASGRVVVRFEGEHQNNKVVERAGQAPLVVVRALVAAARRVRFFVVQPDGPDADRGCATRDPNLGHSMGLVTVTLDGVTRSLDLRDGCFSGEQMRGLVGLADRIELLSYVHGGIGRSRRFDW